MAGSGTNAGIEYQQRVASLLLTFQYGKVEVSRFLSLSRKGFITETRFETDSPIDDIGFHTAENWGASLQVKRALSLSEAPDSDFSKVITQFVKAYVAAPRSGELFSLVTTSDASAKIRYEARKLFESIRLNDVGFSKNPLTKSESETLNLIKRLFSRHFASITGTPASEDDFIAFSKRTFVSILDVEPDMPMEKIALMILGERGFYQPELVWSLLIKNSLHYATERLSINSDGLASVLNSFKVEKSGLNPQHSSDVTGVELLGGKSPACGREVVLVRSFSPEFDYMIVELFRFDEDGSKKPLFRGRNLILRASDTACEVIFRSSSFGNLERFLEDEAGRFKDSKVACIRANSIDDVENTEPAKLYKSYVDDLLRSNKQPEACLHCGKSIISDTSLFVEVDEDGLPNSVGLVHSQCRRPLDRVMGTAKVESKAAGMIPEGFDVTTWIHALKRGQGLMNSLQSGTQVPEHQMIIGWSSDSEYDPDYRCCVRFALSGGADMYAYERGKILRLSKAQAEAMAREFAEHMHRQKELKDPYCFTSKTFSFGARSHLLPIKAKDEDILEILSVEAAPYTDLLSKIFDSCENYYAPLALVRDAASEVPLCVCGLVLLLSNPLRFRQLEENLRDVGFECEPLALKIIRDDRDFDRWMGTIFADGLRPVIDPLFDKSQQLVGGIMVNHFEAMLAERSAQNSGDKDQ